jgi:serine acetyltransferase
MSRSEDMRPLLKRLAKSCLRRTFLQPYIEARLLPRLWGLFLINAFCQRVLGINRRMPCLVHFTSQIVQPAKIHLGQGTWPSLFASSHLYLQAGNGIFLGDNCLIGPGAKIVSANHDPADPKRRWRKTRPVRIGADCWIGANAVILPGVAIGDRAVVGAGAVVTRDVPPGAVVAGNPAQIIRYVGKRN